MPTQVIERGRGLAAFVAEYRKTRTHVPLEAAEILAEEIKIRMLEDAKTGVWYGGRRDEPSHVASAPGEAPAVETHALVDSIKVTSTPGEGAEVSSDSPYALILELGGASGRAHATQIAPRPAWVPAAELVNEMLPLLAKIWVDALTGA